MKLKGVIFDFDGLIIDSEYFYYHIYKEWLEKEYNYKLTKSKFCECVGSDDFAFFKSIEEIIEKPISVADFEMYHQTYLKAHLFDIPLVDGVVDVIELLSKTNLKLAIATSSKRDYLFTLLEYYGLKDYFKVFVTGDDVENVKPDPEVFNLCVEEMELEKTEVLVCEDSMNGVKACNRARVEVLFIPNRITRFSDHEGKFTYLKSIKSLPAYILENS